MTKTMSTKKDTRKPGRSPSPPAAGSALFSTKHKRHTGLAVTKRSQQLVAYGDTTEPLSGRALEACRREPTRKLIPPGAVPNTQAQRRRATEQQQQTGRIPRRPLE